MRVVVIVLAVLAGAKLLAQELIARSAMEEALIAAYRDRAVEACQNAASKDLRAAPLAGVRTGWTKPSEIRLAIGRRDLEVKIWDLDNALWPERFKHPLLVVVPPEGLAGLVCEFDVTLGQAALARL
jgi:hypothetical protein